MLLSAITLPVRGQCTVFPHYLCKALPTPQATQYFIGRIPIDLFHRLVSEGAIRIETVAMGTVTEKAYVITAKAMPLLHKYFEAVGG